MYEPFLKPKDKKKEPKPAVKIYRDGREVCSTTKAGFELYKSRVREMWERQDKKCGLQISDECKARKGRLLISEAQFEHSAGRGLSGAHRDDRILKNGKPYNMAVCSFCNLKKGSIRLENIMEDFDGILFA
jgi:recombinational DNA repair ATPase RecF